MKKIILGIALFFVSFISFAQWSDKSDVNLQISATDGGGDFNTATRSDGSSYVFWMVLDSNHMRSEYLQYLDPNGVKQLGENGLLIAKTHNKTWTQINQYIMVDKDGNAIVAFADARKEISMMNISYFTYKISPKGEMLWGGDGISLMDTTIANAGALKMIQTSDGSYNFVWANLPYEGGAYLEMARLDNKGHILVKKILKSPIPNSAMTPYLIDAGDNNSIIVYSSGDAKDIYAKKVDFELNDVWANDILVYNEGFSGAPFQSLVNVINPKNGGVIIGWDDDRTSSSKEVVYISYIKSDGSYGFNAAANGLQISHSDNLRCFFPQMAYDSSDNSVYVLYREAVENTYQDLNIQKVQLSDGSLLFLDGGAMGTGIKVLPLAPRQINSYSLKMGADGNVGVFAIVDDSINTYTLSSLIASSLKANGDFAWTPTIIYLSNATSHKSKLEVSEQTNNNSWLAFWADTRNINGIDGGGIFAQNLFNTGGLSVSNEKENKMGTNEHALRVLINPNTGGLNVNFYNEKSVKTRISLLNSLGQECAAIYDGNLTKGEQNISYTKNSNLKAGVYIVNVKRGNKSDNVSVVLN